jgi:antitoxin component of MazEF toxin-antitoxin module
MNRISRFKYWSTLVLSTSLWLPAPTLHAGKLYKWVDESGQVRYGDRIPPQYAKKNNETLNKQGVVIDTKSEATIRAQIAEEKRLAKLKAEQESKRQEQVHQERIPLDNVTNEDVN